MDLDLVVNVKPELYHPKVNAVRFEDDGMVQGHGSWGEVIANFFQDFLIDVEQVSVDLEPCSDEELILDT